MATKRKLSLDESVELPTKQLRINEAPPTTRISHLPSGIIPLTATPLIITPPTVISTPLYTPPPPYSVTNTEVTSEEFTCSSPSQFLHSPTTIQMASPKISSSSSSNNNNSDGKSNNTESTKSLRAKVLSLKKAKAIEMKLNYEKILSEKFFLEGGGILIDYQTWRKKPNILKDQYLKQHDIESTDNVFSDLLSPQDIVPNVHHDLFQQHKSVPSIVLTTPPPVTTMLATSPRTITSTTITTTCTTSTGNRLSTSLSSVPDTSHEDIVMRARHEADVMKAISELRKEGLWSCSRLPKVQEPSRSKTHWDYVLEEMRWLATDFSNERRWKMNASKKLCRIVARHHQEREQATQKSIKDEQMRLRKISSTLAKEVRHFWESIQKIVEHKQQLLLEEKRRKAMDIHLNFIVDQTQKYSTWLMEGFQASPTDDPSLSSTTGNDDKLFTPSDNECTDDEETIDNEEIIAQTEGELDYESEIHQLKLEGELPLQELIANLPTDLLKEEDEDDEINSTIKEEEEMEEEEEENDTIKDASSVCSSDYNSNNNNESDQEDETTIAEQEQYETNNNDYDNEINMLQEEGDMPIEQLLKLYMETSHNEEEEEEEGEGEEEGEEEEEEEIGIQSLLEDTTPVNDEQGLNNVAAVAQELQPKGTTLSTTKVQTTIPFLLKHELREYQHIGLDWLVTMHDKRLNGILADEMGLGKTIQTIALLAHLACEKSNWGPHLIIVPTSVMLNWEFELKKWCPGFKILTYLGSHKERKQKRVGWSKYNAFHICITSYNIAVQDHRAFKQKKWKYLILDEAQNIKNFKSQRWQTLLTFNSQHRLLLTGTPLQNNLMELWSLMHFLMPTVFSSHTDFKEWFSNPLTGMIEGSHEYNESIVERLHQVLRPFILRRLKSEVEKQLPSKYEHIVMCKLSKRQRYLYEDYMSRAKTKETLSTGNYLSVINVLMQLRKVCNHPDLFELRPVASPFCMIGTMYTTASLVLSALSSLNDPFKNISFDYYNLNLVSHEFTTEAFEAYRSRQLQAPKSLLIENEEECEINNNDLSWINLDPMQELSSKVQKDSLHRINTFHCRKQPVYGQDMLAAVCTLAPLKPHPLTSWLWSGYVCCSLCNKEDNSTMALNDLLVSYERRTFLMDDILKRFLITVTPVLAPSITLHACHPHPSDLHWTQYNSSYLYNTLMPYTASLHHVLNSFKLQFPETRLVQYDCGKLQNLDLLLRRLRTEGHRVLVFTQMSRMLDILEIFLTYHGYTYLRLDGATPVQKRQLLMEHFNNDSRVFCFILSTRSGGLGVNLTGADTVIFYDSDWNPTMDAQAQDRCHRIGQTRDVHIYRLICQRTIEENILKKASQKRLLGDLAIERAGFTTDFFKKSSINELFYCDSNQVSDPAATSNEDKDMTEEELEKLLLQAEEDHDVKAAQMARAEQVAEKAEFDEQYQNHSSTVQVTKDTDSSSNMRHFIDQEFEGQLSGVELYAMKFIEMENSEMMYQKLRQAEEDIEMAKKEWELGHLQRLREEEEKLAEEERNEEDVLTYDRPELINKIFMDEETGEEMPIWLPPTPPNDNDVDIYVDTSLELSYNTSSVLGPDALMGYIVYSDDDYDVFGLQKPLNDPKPTKKNQKSLTKFKRDSISYPQSLFWRRYTPDILTTRIRKLSPQTKKEGPEWLSVEDWVLIKGLTSVLDLPLLLNATVPAQMPNWTILADFVTSFSKTKRSAVQCKDHIVGILIPREEQMSRTNTNPSSHKGRRDQRSKTSVLQDKGKEITKLFDQCFLWIKNAEWKSKQQTATSSNEGSPRTSMHADLLFKDYEITYGVIQTPSVLAQQRAERIQSEIPRTSQVHQILSQGGPSYNVQMARANLVKPFNPPHPPPPPPPPHTVSDTKETVPTVSRPNVTSRNNTTESTTNTTTYSILGKTTTALSSSASTVTTSATTATTVPAAAVSKSYSGVDISKGLFLGQRLTQQQLLLLRQTALQQQQQQIQLQQQKQQQTAAAAASAIIQPTAAATGGGTVSSSQLSPVLQRHKGKTNTTPNAGATSTIQIPAKLQLPGIDQLRPAITLSNQRVPGTLVRAAGLPSRSMQTDEVLALLRQQQALRLAMQSQTVKLSQGIPTSQASLNEAIAVAAMAAAIKPPTKPILVNPATSSTAGASESGGGDGKPATSEPPHTTHS